MTQTTNWMDQFPAFRRLGEDVLDVLTHKIFIVALSEGSRIFAPGQAPDSFILLLEGTVRVQQSSEGGREIVLYRVTSGESCALTTACLMGYEDYLAEAIAETDIRAIAIPRGTFDDLISRSAGFCRFVFTAFSRRVTDLFRVIDDVAFSRMDIRLAQKLLELAKDADQVAVTQQQLASELGTAREVVSRMLTKFQRRQWIALLHGSIDIENRASPVRLAQSTCVR